MKFQLSPEAPDLLSRALVVTDKKSFLRKSEKVTFERGVVYDTADFEKRFPEFAENVLDVRQQIANANNAKVAQMRTIYGDALRVNKCGACGGAKATILFPIFEEVE